MYLHKLYFKLLKQETFGRLQFVVFEDIQSFLTQQSLRQNTVAPGKVGCRQDEGIFRIFRSSVEGENTVKTSLERQGDSRIHKTILRSEGAHVIKTAAHWTY